MLEGDQLIAFHKELDLIQDCIKRMANNSFMIKGWTVTYVGGLIAICKGEIPLIWIAVAICIGVVAFWYVDAHFLQTERAYRKLYEDVIILRPIGNTKDQYSLDPRKYIKRVDSKYEIMLSATLCPIYGIPFALALLTVIFQFGMKINLVISCWPCDC